MTQAGREGDELSAQARAVRVARMFYERGEYTTHEIADAAGMTYGGAWRLLRNISRVIPIVEPDSKGGKWRLLV